jgi:magnesium chelatase family protein
MIYSFQRFGYEGCLVNIEVDIRPGIPAVDIVGLGDSSVRESRERVRAAVSNSGLEFPSERVLISLSPADIRKEGADHDLAVALAVLAAKDDFPRSQDTPVLVLGGLELSGNITPARGTYAALTTAKAHGIKYAIVSETCEVKELNGVHIERVANLTEAYDALCRIEEHECYPEDSDEAEENTITFTKSEEDSLDTINEINGENAQVIAGMKYAMAVAAAGRHNIIAIGGPGCGKTMLLQCLSEITPNLLSAEQAAATTRIWSLAGLLHPDENVLKKRPFRMPHQTASIEGICGGGPDCRPGEISLAHGGILFLDEAAEFRSSVLQMLRVPLENKSITLSRAGRATTYPADFQLAMAVNPCPCGNYGSKTKICLCSLKSIDQYWKKFSAPLLDRVEIRYSFDNPSFLPLGVDLSLEGIRAMVKQAWEAQYKRQGKLNRDLAPEEILRYIPLNDVVRAMLDKATLRYGFSPRAVRSIMQLARTVADMNGFENVDTACMTIALELRKTAAALPPEL